MGVFQNHLMGAAAAAAGGGAFYDYQIEQSARFEVASTSKLSRSFGTSSDLSKFTLSLWAKRSLTYIDGGNTNWQVIMCEDSGVNGGGAAFGFESGGGSSGGLNNRDRIAWYGLKGASGGSSGGDDRIAGYYYDTTGWMHIVVRFDTSQSSGNKVKYYVNGDGPKERTTTNEPSGDSDNFNTDGETHVIGSTTSNNYGFDGYLAEVIFTDGQSYAPSQFGESKNGVWIPKDPSGTTFGTNGFHLKFQNASALGDDSSGNNNDFTANNMGADHQILDSPTFGS